jgi:hypothetical protein
MKRTAPSETERKISIGENLVSYGCASGRAFDGEGLKKSVSKFEDGAFEAMTLEEGGFAGMRWFGRRSIEFGGELGPPEPSGPRSEPLLREKRVSSKTLTMEDLFLDEEDSSEDDWTRDDFCEEPAEPEAPRPPCEEKRCDFAAEIGMKPGLKHQVLLLKRVAGEGFRVMARQVGIRGAREYAVVWMPDFLDRFLDRVVGTERTFNELIEEDSPCRLHLDLDVSVEEYVFRFDPKKDPAGFRKEQALRASKWMSASAKVEKSLEEFCARLVSLLASTFALSSCSGANCPKGDEEDGRIRHSSKCVAESEISWQVADASDAKKFSKHVVFKIFGDEVLFRSRKDIGHFVGCCVDLKRKEAALTEHLRSVSGGPRKTPRMFEAPPSLAAGEEDGEEEEEEEDGEEESKKKGWNVYDSARPADQNFVRNLVLENLDMGIYKGEREFRTIESTKLGQNRPLVIHSICSLETRSPDVLEALGKAACLSPLVKRWSYCAFSAPENRYRSGIYLPDAAAAAAACVAETVISEPKESEFDYEEDGEDEEEEDEKSEEEPKKAPPAENREKSVPAPFCPISKVSDSGSEFLRRTFSRSSSESLVDSRTVPKKFEPKDFRDCFYDNLVVPFFGPRGYGLSFSGDSSRSTAVKMLWFVDKKRNSSRARDSLLERRSEIIARMKEVVRNLSPAAAASETGDDEEGAFEIALLKRGGSGGNISEERKKDALLQMVRNGDDPLGEKLIADVCRNVEADSGMREEGWRLSYKMEFASPDGVHYVMFSPHEKYKKCHLKSLRTGKAGDCHTNNNVYFLANLNKGVYYQKCHSEKCKNYYVRNAAKLEAGKNLAAFANARERARGPVRNLKFGIRDRALNFVRMSEIIREWDVENSVSAATEAVVEEEEETKQ